MLSSNPLEGTNTAKTLDFGLLSLQHCETVDRGFTQSVVHYYNNPSKLYKRESVVISTFLFLTLIICAFSLFFFYQSLSLLSFQRTTGWFSLLILCFQFHCFLDFKNRFLLPIFCLLWVYFALFPPTFLRRVLRT